MRRALMLAVFASSWLFQLEANTKQINTEKKPITFYGGIGLVESLTSSTFKMDYEPIGKPFDNKFCIPHVEHTKNNISRLSPELFIGLRHNFSNNWFYITELSYDFGKTTHKADFTQYKDAEIDCVNPSAERLSYIRIKHKQELGLLAKVGKDISFCDIYSIFGLSTKKIDITFGLDDSNNFVDHALEVNPSKRVYGLVLGLGASKKINQHLACSMEYRYKVYNSAEKQLDMKEGINKSLGLSSHDHSNRTFKIHSNKHEFALRFSVNV